MKYSLTRSTPRNMRLATCMLCGFQQHIKDLKKVTDKNNRHCGLLICKSHRDATNPQEIPYKRKEKLVGYINKINPATYTYVVNENDDRLPGKPMNGFTTTDINGNIVLQWDSPTDNGSSPINGYRIKFSNPQRIHYNVLEENTQTGARYYVDTVTPNTDYSSYRVAAINGFGVGPDSDEFFYPIDLYATTLINGKQYLAVQNNDGSYSYVLADSKYIEIRE